MNEYKQLFNMINELNDTFIDIWQQVSNIESPSESKQGVDRVGRFFLKYSRKQGWLTEVFEQPIAGNPICITMNYEAEKQPITLSAHIDTVHPIGSFGSPAVSIKENCIYGPGVMDCKGGAVAALMAMTALKNIGFKSRPIQLILQTDEETNSALSEKATINYICKKAENSIAFLNCESIRGNTAVLWRKGVCRYSFDIEGCSAHASRCAERGASAIVEAAHKILELEKMKDPNGITCNCGIISGGSSPNTVPDRCSFIAEIRFNTDGDWNAAERIIRAVAETSFVDKTKCIVKKVSWRPAMEKSQINFMLLDRLNQIYEQCGLPQLEARQSLGGSDAAEITCKGIPCIDSIGVTGDYIHTLKEYSELSSLSEAAKRISIACYFL